MKLGVGMIGGLSVYILLVFAVPGLHGSITCKNQQGLPVDWFIILKLPVLTTSTKPFVKEGLAFHYMDAKTQKWSLSSVSLGSQQNAVAHTLNQIYKADKSKVSYAMYNDQLPSERVNNGSINSKYGHTKGALCLDSSTGFWLIHSVPRFPNPASKKQYSYPASGTNNGQSFLCATFPFNTFDIIGGQLRYNQPWIYDKNMPSSFAKSLPELAKVFSEDFVTKSPYHQSIDVVSNGKQKFIVFSKTAKYDLEIFHDWLAPYFMSDMWSETWQNGVGKLKSDCSGKYEVKNIKEITISGMTFKSTKDHSKWGITTDLGEKWVCIGGINRMNSQKSRGGGFMCLEDSDVWTAFKGIVAGVEECDTSLRFSPKLVGPYVL